MVKFARLADAMSEFFELEASPVEGESIQQKNVISKGEKGKAQKKIVIVHACPSKKCHNWKAWC